MTSELGIPTVGPAWTGCGWALIGADATPFARALLEAPSGRVVTVWESPDAAALHPDARVATSLADAIGDKAVNAVHVATPPAERNDPVFAAAAARRAVLLLPPIAADAADAEDLVAACDGLVAGTAYAERWHPAHLLVSDMVEQGEVGTLTSIRVAVGGAQAAARALDLIGMVLGEDVARLSVQASDSHDGLALAGVTRRGVLVTIATAEALQRSTFELTGSAGVLTASGTMGTEAGGELTLSGTPVSFDAALSPSLAQAERFSLAAIGASPWGYHLLRDLRLQRLLTGA